MGFVTVNQKSLVVIPKAVREKCGIAPGDKLKVFYDEKGDAIVMKKVKDIRDISLSVTGMWKDNTFDFEAARAGPEDRIQKLIDRKRAMRGRILQ